jgi:hypothetical protein
VQTLAVHSFLGQAARPHYEAVATAVAQAAGVAVEPLRETPLAHLPAVVAGPPALLFLCGLPYTRMRDSVSSSRRTRGRGSLRSYAARASHSMAMTRSRAG